MVRGYPWAVDGETARNLAREKDISIRGANVAQQFIIPRSRTKSRFTSTISLEIIAVVQTIEAIHLRFRVIK
jgi:hypothetical protein